MWTSRNVLRNILQVLLTKKGGSFCLQKTLYPSYSFCIRSHSNSYLVNPEAVGKGHPLGNIEELFIFFETSFGKTVNRL